MKGPMHLKIIHRNRIFRECLAAILSVEDQIVVSPLDHTRPHDLESIHDQRPGIVLIDLNLPDRLALELTRRLCSREDGPKVVLVTHANVEEELLECFAAGAHGCILEESSLEDVRIAIEKVSRGETFCSPSMVHAMFHRLAQRAHDARGHAQHEQTCLTARELEILRLVDEDLGNKQVARRLSISLYTVKNHMHSILEKLKVADRAEAVELARKRGWLRPKGHVRTEQRIAVAHPDSR